MGMHTSHGTHVAMWPSEDTFWESVSSHFLAHFEAGSLLFLPFLLILQVSQPLSSDERTSPVSVSQLTLLRMSSRDADGQAYAQRVLPPTGSFWFFFSA